MGREVNHGWSIAISEGKRARIAEVLVDVRPSGLVSFWERRQSTAVHANLPWRGSVDHPERRFLVQSAQSGDLDLQCSQTLLQVDDMVRCYCPLVCEQRCKKCCNTADVPRSKVEILVSLWLDMGKISFNLVYPLRSSSRRLREDSTFCLLAASFFARDFVMATPPLRLRLASSCVE